MGFSLFNLDCKLPKLVGYALLNIYFYPGVVPGPVDELLVGVHYSVLLVSVLLRDGQLRWHVERFLFLWMLEQN